VEKWLMKDPEELAKKLSNLGYTDKEMRKKLEKEGVDKAQVAAIVRKLSSTSIFRKSNLWKALSGFALIITVLAIILLPSSGGRAASLGIIGSLTGGAVMFVKTHRGGERPWTSMAAMVLGAFVLFSGAVMESENMVGLAGEAPGCGEAGGFCVETCADDAALPYFCDEGLTCCGEGVGTR
jgi:hypothetical protein